MSVLRLVWPLLLVASASAAACSSSSPAADTPDASTDEEPPAKIKPDASMSTPTPTPPPSDLDSGGGPLVTDDSGTVTMDGGTVTPQPDSGPIVFLDGGSNVEGGVPCFAGGVVESEPNDTSATASAFTGTICGIVDPGTESDFVSVTLKSTTTTFSIFYTGNITINFTSEGKTPVSWNGSGFPAPPFPAAGKALFMEVKSADAKKVSYTVKLTETP